jgi:hypothetical protein
MALNIELEQQYDFFKATVAELQPYNRLGLTPEENALRTLIITERLIPSRNRINEIESGL